MGKSIVGDTAKKAFCLPVFVRGLLRKRPDLFRYGRLVYGGDTATNKPVALHPKGINSRVEIAKALYVYCVLDSRCRSRYAVLSEKWSLLYNSVKVRRR